MVERKGNIPNLTFEQIAGSDKSSRKGQSVPPGKKTGGSKS